MMFFILYAMRTLWNLLYWAGVNTVQVGVHVSYHICTHFADGCRIK